MKHFSNQLTNYIPLFGILAATFIGIMIFRTDYKFQQVLMVAAAAGYVSWGIVYHLHHKDLTLMVLLEYFSVALLGVVVVFSILFRA